ncbi:expressed unknown protein [Seminavis robusta]|uniref:Uncharacterized protein n=1 Tax=Seminavis robusta TaxID=568900 RepID=A0A9N8HYK7_9STRA|nr:expressed unknown protein [Seminavis robusta]|eukprot:Sro2924_g340350.1 n/a (201) ;mRNA; f:1723-2325
MPSTSFKLTKMSRRMEDRQESPRPTKRRNSGPCATASGLVALTPRQTPLLPDTLKRAFLPPKTPLAPRPSLAPKTALLAPFLLTPKPEIFVPSFDDLDEPTLVPSSEPGSGTGTSLPPLLMAAAGRLRPRRLAPKLAPKKIKAPALLDSKKKASPIMARLEAIASVKNLEASKAVPAPATLKQSRSCSALSARPFHALCA